MRAETRWLVGVDTGGTFTDLVAFEPGSGRLKIVKVPSTPEDPPRAVLNALAELSAEGAPRPHEISLFAHGTTVATNALIEGRGARAGLLITRGFRAVYEARGVSHPVGPELLSLSYQKPPMLVPQERTQEITERVAADGSIVIPLDPDEVRRAARALGRQGVRAIAVSYLFSFANPAHELRTREILETELPGCRVSLSSEVLPVIREYPRLSTTVVDAYVGPIVEGYLATLKERLHGEGLATGQMYVMQSSGGLMRFGTAARHPNQTLLSGPAAGLVAGAEVGRLTGERNLITLDMGGTSTDIGVVIDGQSRDTSEGQIAGQDLGTPMLEIHTLGAGGGTVAWVGEDGLLKMGPQSAGADPGPACYGRGGLRPTLTDASLLLGFVGAHSLLGGRMALDPGAAQRAIEDHVARPLGLSVLAAARGMVKVVTTQVEVGLRLALEAKGGDPRQFALVAFGGAGPIHAARVARDLGIPRVIVPPYPGITSAAGLLQNPVKHLYLRSRMGWLAEFDLTAMNGLFAELEGQALKELEEEGFSPDDVTLLRRLDLRYRHQGYQLPVAVPRTPLREEERAAIRREFDRAHEWLFGQGALDEAVEVVTFHVVAVAETEHLEWPAFPEAPGNLEDGLIGPRPVLFEDAAERVEVPIYAREKLGIGARIEGPAVIEQVDATTMLLSGQSARVDSRRNLIISVA